MHYENGIATQDHAGESTACANANAMEYLLRKERGVNDQEYFKPIDLEEFRQLWNRVAEKRDDDEVDDPRIKYFMPMVGEIQRLRESLEGMVYQFAMIRKGLIWSDGLSALEDAFETLGWDDPAPAPSHMVCDVPGCLDAVSCGWPSPDGYRHTCGKHYRELCKDE